MLYFLLVVEHLAVLLIFWTWLHAVMAGRSRTARALVLIPVGSLLFIWTAAVAFGWIAVSTFFPPMRAITIAPPLLLAVGFAVGGIALWIRASRTFLGRRAAADWPASRIAIVLALVLVVHLVTWANREAAMQKEIASLRLDAYHMTEVSSPRQVSDHDNAAPRYQEIFDTWGNEWAKEWKGWNSSFTDEDFEIGSKESLAFLAARQDVIRRLRIASSIRECRFEHDYFYPHPAILIPEVQSMRDASRLLAMDAAAHFQAGRIEEAANDLDAMWRIADHAGSEPFLVSLLVGLAIEKQTIAALEWGMGNGDWKGKKLPKLALESEGIAARLRMHRCLVYEEAMGILMCCDAAQGTGMEWAVISSEGPASAPAAIIAAYRLMPFFSQDVAIYRERMKRLRSRMERLPLRSSVPLDQGGDFDRDVPGLVSRAILPAQNHFLRVGIQAEVPREGVRLGIRVFRYELEHGKAPAKLEDLVPELMPAVPKDPYGKGAFRYVPPQNGQPWMVYSIGPDGVDDGGARIDAAGKGDIVVSPLKKK